LITLIERRRRVDKINRLTRSLADFAKIVEILDTKGASFAAAGFPRHRLASAPTKARARLVRPKNRGPDQCAPVIFSAITVSER
jgi:hypothetical protein